MGKKAHTHPYKGLNADACMIHVRRRTKERPELLKTIYLRDIEKRSAQGLRNFLKWDDQQQQQRKLEAQPLSKRLYLGVQPLKKWTLEDVRLKRLPVNAFSGEHRWSGTVTYNSGTPTGS